MLPVEQTIHVALRTNPQRRLTTFHDSWIRAGWVWRARKELCISSVQLNRQSGGFEPPSRTYTCCSAALPSKLRLSIQLYGWNVNVRPVFLTYGRSLVNGVYVLIQSSITAFMITTTSTMTAANTKVAKAPSTTMPIQEASVVTDITYTPLFQSKLANLLYFLQWIF